MALRVLALLAASAGGFQVPVPSPRAVLCCRGTAVQQQYVLNEEELPPTQQQLDDDEEEDEVLLLSITIFDFIIMTLIMTLFR